MLLHFACKAAELRSFLASIYRSAEEGQRHTSGEQKSNFFAFWFGSRVYYGYTYTYIHFNFEKKKVEKVHGTLPKSENESSKSRCVPPTGIAKICVTLDAFLLHHSFLPLFFSTTILYSTFFLPFFRFGFYITFCFCHFVVEQTENRQGRKLGERSMWY